MASLDLRPFVVRAAALVDSSPPTDVPETRTLLVEPFLQALGWDTRADACLLDRTVDGIRLEYVPTVDAVPALFVAVEAYGDPLRESRANQLRQTMAWTGVDRAIYTNGREYLLLSGTTDVEYHALRVTELADSSSAIAPYSRDACSLRLECHDRTHVARQLAVERTRLVESIVDRLTAATVQGPVSADELESAVDRFFDRLVVTFAADESGRPDSDGDVAIEFSESEITDPGESRAAGDEPTARSDAFGDDQNRDESHGTDEQSDSLDRADRTDSRTDINSRQESGSRSPPETNRQSDAGDRNAGSTGVPGGTDSEGRNETGEGEVTDGESTDGETGGNGTRNGDGEAGGEYVVRFFNDRGSIGAIGHSTSRGALVEAAEYLLKRGIAGVDVPWGPDDGDGTVLNAEPAHADGTPMAEPQRLSNGHYLDTTGDADDRAGRVEALTARAGLRAMITGDWD
nr:hypothetical protein [Natrinema caseinilyticum]